MGTASASTILAIVTPQSITKPPARPVRAYRSELRQQQAEQTRLRVIAAAEELFAEYGYAHTTFAKIAEAAGVSSETVQAHGPKAALLIAAAERAAFGVTGERDILNLEYGRRFVATQDPEEALDVLVAEQTGLRQRTAFLGLALIGGASADPDLDRYYKNLLADMNKRIEGILMVARDRGWLRQDVPFDELVETYAVIGSVDSYLRITHYDGWPVERYRAWCRRMFAETIFRMA